MEGRLRFAALRLDREQRRLLHLLRRHGPTSRTKLTELLQTSGAAVTRLSRSLLDLGLVEEAADNACGERGRPAIPLRIASLGGYAVGVGIHRGSIEIALLDYAGGSIAAICETVRNPGPEELAAIIGRRMHVLAERNRLLGRRLLGVGIATPGRALSPDGGRWISACLPGWSDVPLRQILEDELCVPVWIENDANAAAIAEYYLGGIVQRTSNALVILMGHGIGAGAIVDGRLLRGELGNAGRVGRLYSSLRPRPTTFDLIDTLREAGCDISSVDEIETVLEHQDDVISAWAARAAKQLEDVLNGGLAWFDPGEIVLASSFPLQILEKIDQHLRNADLIHKAGWEHCPTIRTSKLGRAAPTLGAGLLPIHATCAQSIEFH